MVKVGDTIRVMDHDIEGLRWTVNKVGYVKAPAHTRDFDANYPGGKVNVPNVKKGYWLLSLSHRRAKRGYAYIILPEENFAPHACTDRCEAHEGLLG